MQRRSFLKAGLGAAGTLCLGSLARGDDPVAESDPVEAIRKAMPLFKQMKAELVKLTDKLTLLSGTGGNIAILDGPDGTLLVDSGLPDRATEVAEQAQKAAQKPVTVLINTHWHFDHAGGNAHLARAGARIWATANTRKRLSSDQYNELFQMKSPAAPPEALPSLTFDEAELYVGGEPIHLLAVPPAHTDGDLVIHFRDADVIHTGDLFSNGLYPNIDASSRGWLGGMIAAADRILKLAGPRTRIIPGHGPIASVADFTAYRAMLSAVFDRVAPQVEAGKSVEDVIRSRPTQPFDAKWGQALLNGPTFTRMVYDGLAKHREAPAH